MSEKTCYYDVLGVSKDAAADDIRKAYKRLALRYHPDRNNGSEEAAHRFKEATEAYSVLSDGDKRSRYDRFGHAGVDGAVDFGGDIFSHFQDLFSDFFGPMGGFGGGRGRRAPARGRNVGVEQVLTLEEAVLGCKKEIELHTPVSCQTCGGSGVRDGGPPSTCGTCGGRGQVSTGRGFIMFTQTCPSCAGRGTVVSDPCPSCEGSGQQRDKRSVTVTFPPGIDAGHRLRVGGQGMPGPGGTPAGDLFVDVALEPHERFEREGVDLLTRQRISYPQAALGTTLEITLLDGSTQRVKVKAGTQPGSVVSIPGKGAPRVNSRGVGTLHVVLQLEVPRSLSRRAKKLLRELGEELPAPEVD